MSSGDADRQWTAEQWAQAFNIDVGKAYVCDECGTVIMVTKGGVGNLEPICCEKTMRRLDPAENRS